MHDSVHVCVCMYVCMVACQLVVAECSIRYTHLSKQWIMMMVHYQLYDVCPP